MCGWKKGEVCGCQPSGDNVWGVLLQQYTHATFTLCVLTQQIRLDLALKFDVCVCVSIDNRPTEKGLETRNFLAISHSGACYDHMI